MKALSGAEAVFSYFKDLRDKNIIHDENPYTQAFAGVALNPLNAERKVADIVSLSFNAVTVDDAHLTQLTQLVDSTLNWVDDRMDELHKILGDIYEQYPYEDLLDLPDIQFMVPSADVIGIKR